MTLDAVEFLRRFMLHILPHGFQRIRHFGLLANRVRQTKLAQCRTLLRQQTGAPPAMPIDTKAPPVQDAPGMVCPACQRGRLSWVETLHPQPVVCARDTPPSGWDTSEEDLAMDRRETFLQRPSHREFALQRVTYALGILWVGTSRVRSAELATPWCGARCGTLCVRLSRHGLTPPIG